jgi:hypothetical protein
MLIFVGPIALVKSESPNQVGQILENHGIEN